MDRCSLELLFAHDFGEIVPFVLALIVLWRRTEKAYQRAKSSEYNLDAFQYAAQIAISELPPCTVCSAPATRENGPGSYREQDIHHSYCDEHAPERCVEIPRARSLRPLIALLSVEPAE